ncbi:MAG TPA: FmdB family zinc ribbon protein [Bryobacteraceae bacterium]|nr:FmdB family zinc ribbon protein [Bryobacteraceae bacterium]
MPIYEYKCTRCGEVYEAIQSFSDEPLKTHETCGGAVHRLISPPALQFKGSGWYVTDYARNSRNKTADAAAGENGKKGESTKGDTKAEGGKTESKPVSSSSTTEKK